MSTQTNQLQGIDLREIATDVVKRAIGAGATAAEAVVREGNEFSTMVRLGQVETLKEAGSRALGLRGPLRRPPRCCRAPCSKSPKPSPSPGPRPKKAAATR